MTDDLHDAAAELADAADDVADAAADAVDAPAEAADAIDTQPIADAVESAADDVTHLDHEGRLARLEERLAGGTFAMAEHFHGDYATAEHGHVDAIPEVSDIPVPEAPPETTDGDDEPTDEPPARTHPLLARPFAK